MKDIRLLDLLKNVEAFDQQEDQCLKCSDLVTNPVNCMKCFAAYCLKCNKGQKTCTKCQSKQGFDKIQPKGFQLKCPFNAECSDQLTAQNFIQHILTSTHVDQQTKNNYKQQLGNVCNKGHNLTLMIDNFKNLTHQQCKDCKKVGLARMECTQCNTIYCVKCRPLIFVNGTCSQNHKLSYVIPKQNLPFLCDRCGQNKKNPKAYYVDKKCNIGICEQCYKQIEE